MEKQDFSRIRATIRAATLLCGSDHDDIAIGKAAQRMCAERLSATRASRLGFMSIVGTEDRFLLMYVDGLVPEDSTHAASPVGMSEGATAC